MSTDTRQSLSKTVEFKAVDDDRRVAVGGVLVPDKVDLQGDFIRPDTIRELADGFMRRLQNGGDAEGGVMHAAFPGSDQVSLVENDVLDESRRVGGKTFPAGSWLQTWKFHDERLWNLVKSGVLQGYSLGARDVKIKTFADRGNLPAGVVVPDYVASDATIAEILSGMVVEVSSVDIPAVPDAQMVSVKSAGDLAKAQDALTEGMDACVQVLTDRGHGEQGATELCSYLQDNTKMTSESTPEGETPEGETTGKTQEETEDADKASAEDSPGILERIGRAVLGGKSADDAVAVAEEEAEKAGRVLSQANQERAMQIHDEALDLVASSGQVDTADYQRFAADPAVSYDGGTSSKQTTTDKDTMSESTEDEPPEWAKTLQDDVEELKNQIEEEKSETDTNGGEGEKTAEGGDGEEVPEWAKALQEEISETKSDLEDLAEARGKSQQLGGGEAGGSSEKSAAELLGVDHIGGDA